MTRQSAGSTEKERARLRTHIERLRKERAWGDISDADYRRERAETEAKIAVLLVEPVETRDRRVVRVVWTGAARPFFAAAVVDADEDTAVWSWRPRTDSNRRRQP